MIFKKLSILLLLCCAVFRVSHGQVVINEIQASNNSTIADEDGDYEDWIELFNTGVDTIDVSWYSLSDDYSQPVKWLIPPETTIAPGEYLLIWASGKDRNDPLGPLHTNFSIAQDGEELLLTNLQGVRIDEIPPTRIPSDISYGRYPDGKESGFFFTNPTPDAKNTNYDYRGQVNGPVLSHEGGFYETPFFLKVAPHASDTIHYTLDGSEPTRADPILLDSLEISVRSPHDNLLSYIPTNPPESGEGHIWREPGTSPALATTLRLRAFRGDAFPSRIVTHTYFIAAENSNKSHEVSQNGYRTETSNRAGNEINNGVTPYSLPVISLVTDSLHLFDHETGIYIPGKRYEDNRYIPPWGSPYANYFYRGEEWERPASIEFFDPDHGRVLNQDIGIRIHGGMSRAMPMKSLRLYARSNYGTRRFEYPFFSHPDADPYFDPQDPEHHQVMDPPSYNRLILRNSGQDFYRYMTMFRDAMIQGLVRHLNLDTQAYRPAILFINGEFWGIMNIRERYDKHYLARTYNIDPEQIDYLTARRTVKEGSAAHYESYRETLRTHDLRDSLNYALISTMLDIDNFMDYNIANIYANNRDWPGNNRDFFRYQTEYDPQAPPGQDGRWRYMLIDTDFGFGHQDSRDDARHNMLAAATGSPTDKAPNPSWSTTELQRLLFNTDFRNNFINRFADYLNTFLSPSHVRSHIQHYQDLLEPVIEDHIARWRSHSQISHWRSHIDVMNYFADNRPFHVREHIMDHFDLEDTASVTLDIRGPERSGYLQINETPVNGHTLGIPDNPYPWSGVYFSGIPVTISAKARSGYRFAGWAELPGQTDSTIVINPGEDMTLTGVFEADVSTDHSPAPHDLSNGSFEFDYWPGNAPTGSYPEHMLFQYMDRAHPGVEAHVAGNVHMSYNRDSGTRLLGLGERGIAFLNSDSESDTTDFYENRLGAVVAGLRTINHGQIEVSWTSETIQPHSRSYAIRLEYRIGDEGAFIPVMNHLNLPVTYKRDEEPGHQTTVGPVILPEEVEDQPYVQLRWRYYDATEHPATAEGKGPMLRIDNINVSSRPVSAETESEQPQAFRLSQNYPNPFNNRTVIPFQMPLPGQVTITIYTIDGQLVNQHHMGHLQAGNHSKPIHLSEWASGIYLAQIRVISQNGKMLYRETRRMTMIK